MVSTLQIRVDMSSIKLRCRAPGFISAEIFDVFTFHACGKATLDKNAAKMESRRLGQLFLYAIPSL